MGKEIERKFLIDHAKWERVEKSAGEHFQQGYLMIEPEKTIRIRVTPAAAFITIKGISVGATRAEYEYEIPRGEGAELLENFAVSRLVKIRYSIPYEGKVWEVDVFLEDNAGLVVAEIELQAEDEVFEVPSWIGREVTGETRYYNSNLTISPFKRW